jgi:metallo-beta-lactamase family protein
MKITFYGAAREVTGSKHLIEVDGRKILLDCGMFQGKRAEAEQKNRELPFDAESINFVLLSHAHLDHCGSLPTLYKNGFHGKIISTPATRDISRYIMADSAHIQQTDNEYIAYLKNQETPEPPVYTEDDVEQTLSLFETVDYYQEFKIGNNIKAVFKDAGHILGSALLKLAIKTSDKEIALGYTGDLGRKGMPILRDSEYLNDLDVLIIESTYGDRVHETLEKAKRTLEQVITEGVKRRAKIIVPAFALGRTQLLIYLFHQLTSEGRIPEFPIYVDSPLAINITDVFKAHPECFDRETFEIFEKEKNPFGFGKLQYVRSANQSRRLNHKKGPLMIISSAGMMEGGRVRHHLVNTIENPNNIIIITGFMAKDTLGRKIEQGEKSVKIFDRMYNVRAKIVALHSLSAHGDSNDLLDFVKNAGSKLKNIFLVHGEPEESVPLKEKILSLNPSYSVKIPQMGDSFEL